MPKVDSIITFAKTKKALKSIGISVSSQDTGYVPSTHFISNIVANNGTLECSDEGIFYITSEGHKYRGYLYLLENSVGGIPKAHICECSTLRDFKLAGRTQRFGWANKSSVFVKSSMSGQVFQVDDLQICKNCLYALNAYRIPGFPKNTKSFVNRLETGNDDELFSVKNVFDRQGNTSDWYLIRRRYLDSVNYCCEQCHRSFVGLDEQMFLDVVHIDRDKTHNMQHNLQCLCVDCKRTLGHGIQDNLFSLYREIYDPTVKQNAIYSLINSLQSATFSIFVALVSHDSTGE